MDVYVFIGLIRRNIIHRIRHNSAKKLGKAKNRSRFKPTSVLTGCLDSSLVWSQSRTVKVSTRGVKSLVVSCVGFALGAMNSVFTVIITSSSSPTPEKEYPINHNSLENQELSLELDFRKKKLFKVTHASSVARSYLSLIQSWSHRHPRGILQTPFPQGTDHLWRMETLQPWPVSTGEK